jgi:hypothetical protein
MGHDLDVPNLCEPGLNDDELVAVRGLIQERYSLNPHIVESPKDWLDVRGGTPIDPSPATFHTAASQPTAGDEGSPEVSDIRSSPSGEHPDEDEMAYRIAAFTRSLTGISEKQNTRLARLLLDKFHITNK